MDVQIVPLPSPLPAALVEVIAKRFRVLGEPMRITILDRLRDREASVQELVGEVAASQQNVSKHLQVLHDAGIVARRKQGNRVYYRIADEAVFALCEHVCGSVRRHVDELAGLVPSTLGAAR